jgi:hypothetical protein
LRAVIITGLAVAVLVVGALPALWVAGGGVNADTVNLANVTPGQSPSTEAYPNPPTEPPHAGKKKCNKWLKQGKKEKFKNRNCSAHFYK